MADRYVDYLPLDEIQPATRNPKAHDQAGIARSVGHFGLAELPLVDDRTGRLVAGHGRYQQLTTMREAGAAPPDGVRVDDTGAWLMPVVRGWSSRSDDDAEAYLVASNQLTVAGGWDDRELAEMLNDLASAQLLELSGFADTDLERLLDDVACGDRALAAAGLTDPDDVPGVPVAPISKPGDLWLLGPHRLLCGDSTNPEHVARVVDGARPGLIYTDPPYGIKAVPKDGGVSRGGPFGGVKAGSAAMLIPATKYAQVIGDDNTDTARDAFSLLTTTYPDARHVWWGANHYVGSANLPDSSCWIVWDKENASNDFADAELAWTNHRGATRLLRHMWNGMLRASERGKRVHPTQKPVALAVWAFDAVRADKDAAVLDVFAGSGSTLIAAHQTGRRAYLIEIDPLYVDTICRRFQEHTGTTPILDATGDPHDFTRGETGAP